MTELTRRAFIAGLGAAASIGLAACSAPDSGASPTPSGESTAAVGSSNSASSDVISGTDATGAAGPKKHIVGVAVYNISDNEVLMFRQYLVDYVAKVCFDDVQFIYSSSITSEEELIAFIDQIAAMGGEGLMSFYNIDLPAEVARCAQYGMYHIVASGTVSEADFKAVEDNEYFLGAVGPMIQMEYNAGSNMVTNFVGKKAGSSYFIMSGGAGMGNEMHYQRTFGMLDALETGYGTDLGDTKALAASEEATTVEADGLTVTISPGYVSREAMRQPVVDSFKGGTYDVVLSTVNVGPILDTLRAAKPKIAMVDCYSQDNQILFTTGQLDYLVGKYGSLVGPSFVALYNAITGHAADFRDDGKAFQVVQEFWSSDGKEDFDEKYELASNITTPAFNYEDLYSICKEHTPSATYEDFVKLASAVSYEDAVKRRQAG